MAWFRRKPVCMQAVQWLGDNLPEIEALVGGNFDTSFSIEDGELFIHTLEGRMHASINDWIVKGVDEEVWAVKPHIFERTYEPIVEPDRDRPEPDRFEPDWPDIDWSDLDDRNTDNYPDI